ncbi:MAG: hypothetical protein LUC85_07325 [Bacteroidales bacterium]|nr:hypothetical protein [Bacteroidales bacterium]
MEEDQLYEQYEEFRRRMLDGRLESYYDEETLIEVFDTAGDQNDDATRMAVLSLAARLHPSSEDLNARRAFYFYLMGDTPSAVEIIQRPHGEHILWDILDLTLNPQNINPQPGSDITRLIQKYQPLDDEEAIRIVDFAALTGQLPWLIENASEVEKSLDYPSTLYYEIASKASETHDNDTILQATEKLTALEPFTDYFWIMQSRALAEKEKVDDALQSLDYALAINPSNPEARLLRAQLVMLADDKANDEIRADLEALYREYPDNTSVARTLAVIYETLGQEDKARELYINVIRTQLDASDTLPLLLHIDHTEDTIEQLWPELSDINDQSNVVDMANKMMRQQSFAEASALLRAAWRHNVLTYGFENMVEAMYCAGEYAAVERLLSNPQQPGFDAYYSPTVSMIYAFSVLRIGHRKDTLEFIDSWFERAHNVVTPTPGHRVFQYGVETILRCLKSLLGDFRTHWKAPDGTPGGLRAELETLDPYRPRVTQDDMTLY